MMTPQAFLRKHLKGRDVPQEIRARLEFHGEFWMEVHKANEKAVASCVDEYLSQWRGGICPECGRSEYPGSCEMEEDRGYCACGFAYGPPKENPDASWNGRTTYSRDYVHGLNRS